MNSLYGELAALVTAVCWTYNSIAFSHAGRRVGSATVNHVRLWVALAALLPIHLVAHGSLLASGLGWQATAWLALSGIVGYVVGDAFLFEAFVLIGARLSMLLMLLAPIFSSILARIFLGERLNSREMSAILIAVAGIGIVIASTRSGDGAPRRNFRIGLLLGIGGAAGQAGGLLLSKLGMMAGASPIAANQVRVVAALAVLTPYFLLRGRLGSDMRKMRDHRALVDITSGAMVGPVLGVILSLVAIRHAHIGIASTLMSLSPVLLLPISRYLFNEHISMRAVTGTIIALAGSAMLFF
ncbi:MAG: DMT family transporter [Acidobacteriota bacterium]|jgi:drug/metabolite transporter (DMT)-like permease|nr:DMT family transporter [Acidobacteriota bacterium]